MLTSLAVAKLAVNVVSSVGVAKIISDIVKNNTVVVTTVQKVTVNTGSFVLGAMIVDHSWKYVNDQIDQLINANKKEQSGAVVDEPLEVITYPSQ